MSENEFGRVERRPTTVDLSWFLDLHKNSQLDLEPSYQRRSVWTGNDRRYFLDTIFRNYPSPAIFLHKSIEDDGTVTYHVVDGKQRITTILQFVENKLYLPKDFGDERLNGRRWRQLEPPLRKIFWNYPIPIEQIDAIQGPTIQEVFARLNKNSRKLTRQELRHARFDGWLIEFLENEVLGPEWHQFRVRTTVKEKRMLDVQNLSELFEVVARGHVVGFDQDKLDELYAEFDEPDSQETEADTEALLTRFNAAKDYLLRLEEHNQAVSIYAQPFLHLHTLWTLLVIDGVDKPVDAVAGRYAEFMEMVRSYEFLSTEPSPGSDVLVPIPVGSVDDGGALLLSADDELAEVAAYKLNSTGASTELPQRVARLSALRTRLANL